MTTTLDMFKNTLYGVFQASRHCHTLAEWKYFGSLYSVIDLKPQKERRKVLMPQDPGHDPRSQRPGAMGQGPE